jgi:hypothetical protein
MRLLVKAIYDNIHEKTLPGDLLEAFEACYKRLAVLYKNTFNRDDASSELDVIFDIIPPGQAYDASLVRCICVFKATIKLDERFLVRALFKGIERDCEPLVISLLSGELSEDPRQRNSLKKVVGGQHYWADYISDKKLARYLTGTNKISSNTLNPFGALAPGGSNESALGAAVRLGRANLVGQMLKLSGPCKYDWTSPNALSPFLQLCQLNHPAQFLQMLEDMVASVSLSRDTLMASLPPQAPSATFVLSEMYMSSLDRQSKDLEVFTATWQALGASMDVLIHTHMMALQDPRLAALPFPSTEALASEFALTSGTNTA